MSYIRVWDNRNVSTTRNDLKSQYASLIENKNPDLSRLAEFYNDLTWSDRGDVATEKVPCLTLNSDLDGCLYTEGNKIDNCKIGVSGDNLGIDTLRILDMNPKYFGLLKDCAQHRIEKGKVGDWNKQIRDIVGELASYNVREQDFKKETKNIVDGIDISLPLYLLKSLNPDEINVFTGTPDISTNYYMNRIISQLADDYWFLSEDKLKKNVKTFGTPMEVNEKGIFTGEIIKDETGKDILWDYEKRAEKSKELSKHRFPINILKRLIKTAPSISWHNMKNSDHKIGTVVSIGNTQNDIELLKENAEKGVSYYVGDDVQEIKNMDDKINKSGVYFTDVPYIPTALRVWPGLDD